MCSERRAKDPYTWTGGLRAGALCGFFFLLLGCLFVPYPGLQQDESLFAAPLYREWSFYSIPLAGNARIPLMHMSYVGALKTWLYAPLMLLWPPTPASLRVPAVVIGVATIVLFGILLESVHGRRAAWIGCLLLATDSIFLLTTTFDWGPVALQHLLMTAAMLFAVLWCRNGRDAWLAAAAFCCGLAFWDKAIFVWMFTGLLAGSLVFIRQVWRRLTMRCLIASAAALCLGALPLLTYNFAQSPRFATIHSTSQFGPKRLREKFHLLGIAWNGSGLFWYIVRDSTEHPSLPHSAIEKTSFVIHAITGDHRTNMSNLALFAGLALLPLLWRTRARDTLLFSAIACGVAWPFMAFSGGGTSVHHAVLLWPLPHLFLAVAFAEASLLVRFGQWLAAGAVALLVLANLAVTNQYLFQFVRNGTSNIWTDAIYPLSAGLRNSRPTQVVLIDWGATDPLCLLNRNVPPVRSVADPFMPPNETAAEKQADLDLLHDSQAIWVEHTSGNEMVSGVNERLLNAARTAGFDEVTLEIYADRAGRPIFRAFRFVQRP